MQRKAFESKAGEVLARTVDELRTLTFESAAKLPEASDRPNPFGDKRCSLTTVVLRSAYGIPPGSILIVAMAARRRWFGIASEIIEKGLVFLPDGTVREATEIELRKSGG